MSELKRVVGIPRRYIIDMNESMDVHPIYISKLVRLFGDVDPLFEECLNIGFHFCTMSDLGFDVNNMDYNLTDHCYGTIESLIDGLEDIIGINPSDIESFNENIIQLASTMSTIIKDLMLGMGPVLDSIVSPDSYITCTYDWGWVASHFGGTSNTIYPEIALLVDIETWG